MKYTIPLGFDQTGGSGVFYIGTSVGPVVVFFQGDHGLQRFVQVMAPVVQREGRRLGFTRIEANSIEEAIELFSTGDPALKNVRFVSSDSSIATQIIEHYSMQSS